MRLLRLLRIFSPGVAPPNDPTPSVISEHEREKEHMLSEIQWKDTFQESLRDFRLKFEQEEAARSAGERARQDEFDRTMTTIGDIFWKNYLRRQALNNDTDTLQELRFQRADAAREAIFVQGQQDRACAYEIEQEMRGKRVEWYSTVRKGLFSEGRQRLAEKYDALNAALVDQFGRLMERQKGMGEVASCREQLSDQDRLIPVPGHLAISALFPDTVSHPPDRGSGTVYSQTVTLSPSPSNPLRAESLNSLIQPSTGYTDQQDTPISQSPSLIRSSSQTSSLPLPESLNSLTQSTSIEPNDKQEESPHMVEQSDPEGSTLSDEVEDTFNSSFMRSQEQRQKTFLRDERKRKRRFRRSEAARDMPENGESKRSKIFDQQMKQWSLKSQTELVRGREEERFRREIQRSMVFRNAESQHRSVFEILLQDIKDQVYAEEDLEEIHFKRQEDLLLVLYERQAIQLNQRTEAQIVWLKFMRDRTPVYRRMRRLAIIPRIIPRSYPADGGFELRQLSRGRLIQRALPIPKVMDSAEHNRLFERSQELRAEAFQKGAKERNYEFTINEAKRETEFVKAQQERKEAFYKAEELREFGFEEVRQQREYEFEANEQKRENDFYKNEVERNEQTREAREERAEQFQSMIVILQEECVANEQGRLKELELLGEELITSREQGLPLSREKFPPRVLDRLRIRDFLLD